MKRGNSLGFALALGLTTFAGWASAAGAEASTPAVAAVTNDGHASGLMVQGRMQAQGGLLSLGGGPSFLLGYQGPSYALGLGVGLNRLGLSAGTQGSGSLTLFQVMPTALIDVWHSADGRARANLIGGIGYGRGSLNVTATTQSCSTDNLGVQTCSNRNQDGSASAGFIPVMLGFGGDYFLSRNFSLGAEFGLQGAFTTSIDTQSGSVSQGVDASANLQLTYGALRATFVLGD